MAKISTSEDVYRQLIDESDERWLFGLIAFAIIEEQRIEWMSHFEEHNSGKPSADEIRHWYEQQPAGVLLRAKGDAEATLSSYSFEVLEEALQAERRDVSDGVIVSEIRLLRKFLPQFGINVLGGFTSAALFAALLVLLAFFVFSDPSPIKWGKGLIGD